MVKNAAETTGISQKTVVQMYQYFRDVYSTKHINSPAQLGGPGIVVQIDENFFNHKLKYQRGRRPSNETWVFGIVDTSTKPAITYMEAVAKRDKATLLSIRKNSPTRLHHLLQRMASLQPDTRETRLSTQ
jgi:hypothetical protein